MGQGLRFSDDHLRMKFPFFEFVATASVLAMSFEVILMP